MKPEKIQPTRELLQSAADILRERGLARDKLLAPDGSGRVCMLGACGLAVGIPEENLDDAAYLMKFADFLAEELNGGRPAPTPFILVTAFNDRARDVEEVASFLERAAQDLS